MGRSTGTNDDTISRPKPKGGTGGTKPKPKPDKPKPNPRRREKAKQYQRAAQAKVKASAAAAARRQRVEELKRAAARWSRSHQADYRQRTITQGTRAVNRQQVDTRAAEIARERQKQIAAARKAAAVAEAVARRAKQIGDEEEARVAMQRARDAREAAAAQLQKLASDMARIQRHRAWEDMLRRRRTSAATRPPRNVQRRRISTVDELGLTPGGKGGAGGAKAPSTLRTRVQTYDPKDLRTGRDLEQELAGIRQRQKVSGGNDYQDADLKLTVDAYIKYKDGVTDRFQKLVAKLTDLNAIVSDKKKPMDARLKAQRAYNKLISDGEWKKLLREHERLFGKKHDGSSGAVVDFAKEVNAAQEEQFRFQSRQYYGGSLTIALGDANNRQLLDKIDRERGWFWDSDHVFRRRTLEEELDFREQERQKAMTAAMIEQLKLQGASQVYKSPGRMAINKFLVENKITPQMVAEDPHMARGIVERLLAQWDNEVAPTITGEASKPVQRLNWEVLYSSTPPEEEDPLLRKMVAVQRQRNAYERDLYAQFGMTPPDALGKIMSLPVVEGAMNMLGGPYAMGGSLLRALGAAAGVEFAGPEQGLNIVEWAQTAAGILTGKATDAQRDKMIYEIARYADMKAVSPGLSFLRMDDSPAAKERARADLDKFVKNMFGDGDTMTKLRYLNEYGNEVAQDSPLTNMFLGTVLDPTNLVPLAVWTYPARVAYAARIAKALKTPGAGLASDLKSILKGGVAGFRVDAAKLRVLDDSAELISRVAGVSTEKAKSMLRDELANIKPETQFDEMVTGIMERVLGNVSGAPVNQLRNYVEELVLSTIEHQKQGVLRQVDEIKAKVAAKETSAAAAKKRVEEARKRQLDAEKAARAEQRAQSVAAGKEARERLRATKEEDARRVANQTHRVPDRSPQGAARRVEEAKRKQAAKPPEAPHPATPPVVTRPAEDILTEVRDAVARGDTQTASKATEEMVRHVTSPAGRKSVAKPRRVSPSTPSPAAVVPIGPQRPNRKAIQAKKDLAAKGGAVQTLTREQIEAERVIREAPTSLPNAKPVFRNKEDYARAIHMGGSRNADVYEREIGIIANLSDVPQTPDVATIHWVDGSNARHTPEAKGLMEALQHPDAGVRASAYQNLRQMAYDELHRVTYTELGATKAQHRTPEAWLDEVAGDDELGRLAAEEVAREAQRVRDAVSKGGGLAKKAKDKYYVRQGPRGEIVEAPEGLDRLQFDGLLRDDAQVVSMGDDASMFKAAGSAYEYYRPLSVDKINYRGLADWVRPVLLHTWVKKLDVLGFARFFGKVAADFEMSGAFAFSRQVQPLFLMFHQMKRLNPDLMPKIHDLMVQMAFDPGSMDKWLMARTWLLMESRAGLPFALPYMVINKAFGTTALKHGMIPELALGMFPGGFRTSVSPHLFGLGPEFGNLFVHNEWAARWTATLGSKDERLFRYVIPAMFKVKGASFDKLMRNALGVTQLAIAKGGSLFAIPAFRQKVLQYSLHSWIKAAVKDGVPDDTLMKALHEASGTKMAYMPWVEKYVLGPLATVEKHGLDWRDPKTGRYSGWNKTVMDAFGKMWDRGGLVFDSPAGEIFHFISRHITDRPTGGNWLPRAQNFVKAMDRFGMGDDAAEFIAAFHANHWVRFQQGLLDYPADAPFDDIVKHMVAMSKKPEGRLWSRAKKIPTPGELAEALKRRSQRIDKDIRETEAAKQKKYRGPEDDPMVVRDDVAYGAADAEALGIEIQTTIQNLLKAESKLVQNQLGDDLMDLMGRVANLARRRGLPQDVYEQIDGIVEHLRQYVPERILEQKGLKFLSSEDIHNRFAYGESWAKNRLEQDRKLGVPGVPEQPRPHELDHAVQSTPPPAAAAPPPAAAAPPPAAAAPPPAAADVPPQTPDPLPTDIVYPDGADMEHYDRLLGLQQKLTGMSEDDWLRRLQRENGAAIKRMKKGSPEYQRLLQQQQDIALARAAIRAEKGKGVYMTAKARRKHSNRIKEEYGEQVKGLIAPRKLAPYAENDLQADVEVARSIHRTLRESPVEGPGNFDPRDWKKFVPEEWEDLNGAVGEAIVAARGGIRRTAKLNVREPNLLMPQIDALRTMRDDDPRLIKAKKDAIDEFYKQRGRPPMSVEMYDRVRTLLERHVGAGRRAKALARDADAANAAGETFEGAFLRLRQEAVDEDAVNVLGWMATKYPSLDGEELVDMMRTAWTDDGTIRFDPDKITEFDAFVLRKHLEHLTWADYTDDLAMANALGAHGTLPPMDGKYDFKTYQTRIGAWSPRSADDIAAGRRGWSIDDERTFWLNNYRRLPPWLSDPSIDDGTLFNSGFDFYREKQMEWGNFDRSVQQQIRLTKDTGATIRDIAAGNEAKGIKAQRDWDLQRRFAIERYGERVHDGEKMTAMPWLMTREELATYVARGGVTKGLITDPQVLDAFQSAVEKVIAKRYPKFLEGLHDANWGARLRGESPGSVVLTPADYHEFTYQVLTEVMATLKLSRREIVGDMLDVWSAFWRSVTIMQPGFTVSNIVDSNLKGRIFSFNRRGIMAQGTRGQRAIENLEAIGEGEYTALVYNGRQRHFRERFDAETTYGRRDQIGAVLDLLSNGLARKFAKPAEDSNKLRMAQEMYDGLWDLKHAEFAKQGFDDETIDLMIKALIKKEMNRIWPTLSKAGPFQRFLNQLSPFISYNLQNQIVWIREAFQNPWMLVFIRRGQMMLAEYNRERWEEEHPGTPMPEKLLHLIPLGDDLFFDIGVFTDSARGLRTLYDGDKSVVDHLYNWVRLFSPAQRAAMLGVTDAMGLTGRYVWVQTKHPDGSPTGQYERVRVPIGTPWSGDPYTFADTFWFLELGNLYTDLTKDGTLSSRDMMQLMGKTLFFKEFAQPDPYKLLMDHFSNLPDAAKQEFLKTESGQRLKEWLARNEFLPREYYIDPNMFKEIDDWIGSSDLRKIWFSNQSQTFKDRMLEGYRRIGEVEKQYDQLLSRYVDDPENPEAKRLAWERRSLITALYSEYPEMTEYEVMGLTPVEWEMKKRQWQVDQDTDVFMSLFSEGPDRAKYRNEAAYLAARKDWEQARDDYLLAHPLVAQRLDKVRSEYDAAKKQVQHMYGEVFDRFAERERQIRIAEKRGDEEAKERAYWLNDLDAQLLETETFGRGWDGDTTGRLSIFRDFEFNRFRKATPAEREGLLMDRKLADIRKQARVNGKFDPSKWYRLMRKPANADALARYLQADQERAREFAKNEKYMQFWGRQARLAEHGKWEQWWDSFEAAPDWIRDRYYDKNPGKRGEHLRNAAYMGYMGKWMKLKGDAAFRYFDNLPDWVRDRYFQNNPDSKMRRNGGFGYRPGGNSPYARALDRMFDAMDAKDWDRAEHLWNTMPERFRQRYLEQNPGSSLADGFGKPGYSGGGSSGGGISDGQFKQYMGYMKRWVGLLESGKKDAANDFFRSMPKWAQDFYIRQHPDKEMLRYDDAMTRKLARYFGADKAHQAEMLANDPGLVAWLRSHSGESSRINAILFLYSKLPQDAWLRRTYREKYPEVFSPEARGERKIESILASLAENPEFGDAWVKMLERIWGSAEEALKYQKTTTKYVEMDRKRRRRKHTNSYSAAEIRERMDRAA